MILHNNLCYYNQCAFVISEFPSSNVALEGIAVKHFHSGPAQPTIFMIIMSYVENHIKRTGFILLVALSSESLLTHTFIPNLH